MKITTHPPSSLWRLFQTRVIGEQPSWTAFTMALASMFPVFFVFYLALTVVWVRRDLVLTLLLVGLLGNEVLNQVLKHTIRDLRPAFANVAADGMEVPVEHQRFMGVVPVNRCGTVVAAWRDRHEGYGMPSSHAQFSAFLAVHSFLRRSSSSWWFAVLAVVICYSRVHLEYHTVQQVWAGAAVGAAAAFAYRIVERRLLRPLVSKAFLSWLRMIDSDGVLMIDWEFEQFSKHERKPHTD